MRTPPSFGAGVVQGLAALALAGCPRPASEDVAAGGAGGSTTTSSGPSTTVQASNASSSGAGAGEGASSVAGGGEGGAVGSGGGDVSTSTSGGGDGGALGVGGSTSGGGDGGARGVGGAANAGGGGAGGACLGDEVLCDDQCRDVTSDPLHCGDCDHSCLDGECAASACEPVFLRDASGTHFNEVATHAGRMWWVDAGPGLEAEIRSAPDDAPPGAPSTLLTAAGFYASRLAFTSTHAYWVERPDDGVFRASLEAPSEPELVGSCSAPTAVAPAGPEHVVVACYDDRSILRIDVETGEQLPLATGLKGPLDVVVDDTFAFYVDFAQNNSRGDVVRVALDGLSTPEALAEEILDLERVGRALDRVVFTGRAGLYSLDASGGLQEPDVLADGDSATSLAVDGGSVFWIDRGDFSVHAFALDSGIAQTWPAQGEVFEVAASARAVFWVSSGVSGTNGILRLAR